LPRRAPWQRRRLKFTRAGSVVVGLTLAVGFAAFNTGNNLLFFGWGLMLSSIVVSGILSEATLRSVHVEPHPANELRAGVLGTLPFIVENNRALPAFAIEVQALLRAGVVQPRRAFLLRLDAGARRAAELALVPVRRGTLVIEFARVLTAFPFGFFEKEKRVPLEPPMRLVVFPARVDVGEQFADVLTRLGDAPAQRPGAGEETFSLRPFRVGDDPRHVAWRRSIKTGRIVVKESEAVRSHDIILELAFGSDVVPADLDLAAAVCGSLAEDLLAAGHAVGLRGGHTSIAVGAGARQRAAILTALALVTAGDRLAALPPSRCALVVAVVARGAAPPAHATVVIDAASVPA
jgi:uncharacterized protein (DUF58 family)